jgi:Fur family zinc uptake transcriptional regulator
MPHDTSSSDRSTSKSFEPHDHAGCVADAVAALETYCQDQGLKLTPVRRRVAEILLAEHRAMGAYEILDVLRAEGLGSQPPVAYRALDFLSTHGFVHKIERLNAFVACTHPGASHSPAFLICRSCNKVAEADTSPVDDQLGRAAAAAGFQIEQAVVEAEGLCPDCAEPERTGAESS